MKTVQELYASAVLFWPKELVEREASLSVIPLLLQTQDQFISLLDVSDLAPDSWKLALKASGTLSPNLFLKHLMVLSDFGGEPLQRMGPVLGKIFPKATMTFHWKGRTYKYTFRAAKSFKKLDNKMLGVDGPGLLKPLPLTDAIEDTAMLLLHGGSSVDSGVPDPVIEKCIIGGLLGQKEELKRFIRQRYILVSRITQGAKTNTLGQLAQDYVKEVLEAALPDWTFARDGSIPGISQNAGKTDISFDVVGRSKLGFYVAIEVMFQVTTNSVIERKSGQAENRAEAVHSAGYHIAYVVDGAGSFQRQSALTTICQFSDCTVTMDKPQLNQLAEYLRALETEYCAKPGKGRG
jgi:hypothetical protein